MFSDSNLTIRFLVGGVVAALLLLLAVGGGTGFVAVLYLNNEITGLSSEFGAMAAPAVTMRCRSFIRPRRRSRIS